MKLRAFVVMPYGQSVKVSERARDPGELVNFGNVYENLLKPALERAGCLPFRADAETTAGDIRTDMFYELVTADLVVADVSASNVNVFYELGIRDAMCARGVFLVRGDWPWVPPFDIAPDRIFTYHGKFFEVGTEAAPPDGLEAEVAKLEGVLKQAIRDDSQTIGSPVYMHLPGLIAPVWKDVQIPRARYFMSLRDQWVQRVRTAQEKGKPGNILTLAQDAPSRVDRSQVLFTAAQALIGLCRYDAAEQVLREILSIDQDHRDAHLHLAIVLEHQGRIEEAEVEIRTLLDQQNNDAAAKANLGHVYRSLWRLMWKRHRANAQQARKLARDNYVLALSAFRNFSRALEMDPGSYFGGFNAVLLLAIIDDLFDGARPSEFGSHSVTDLIQIVSFVAKCARRRAEESENHDDHFWSTTTLSGLAMLKGTDEDAYQLLEDACAFPQTTLFQKEILMHRLRLLQELGFKTDFAKRAIDLIARSIGKKKSYKNVVLFYEHFDTVSGLQLTHSQAEAVSQQIVDRLARWNIGPGDLALSCGVREGDILFAEACQRRNVDVRLLILGPSAILGEIWHNASDRWASRFQKLAHGGVDIWKHEQELGEPLDPSATQETHNRWVLNTARMEAYASKDSQFFGLILWNGDGMPPDSDDPQSPGYFVAGIRSYSNYQGLVEAITAVKPGEPPRSADVSV